MNSNKNKRAAKDSMRTRFILQNSFLQTRRAYRRNILFFTLILLCSLFLSLGAGMWALSAKNLTLYQQSFKTIVTVAQNYDAVEIVEMPDILNMNNGKSEFSTRSIYSFYAEEADLLFEGANYKTPPAKRAVYGAVCAGMESIDAGRIAEIARHWGSVVEFTPKVTGSPSEGLVEIKITKVLFGNISEGENILVSAHNYIGFENAPLLEVGKTYIAHIPNLWAGDEKIEEYFFNHLTYSPLVNRQGEPIVVGENNDASTCLYNEVIEDFYTTPKGQRWLEALKVLERFKSTVPVTPTHGTRLLLPMYSGEGSVILGRDISEEEYKEGNKVCLVPQNFAQRNNLAPGDEIPLDFYFANYGHPAISMFQKNRYTPLSAVIGWEEKALNFFEKSSYTIVGIYQAPISADYEASPNNTMAMNEIIVPYFSIENREQENIVETGPIQAFNTSFEIENGSGVVFQQAVKDIPIFKNATLTIYDNGYQILLSGMESIQGLSRIVFFISSFASAAVLFFYWHLYGNGQRKLLFIQRSLGYSKKESALSFAVGAIPVFCIGVVLGATGGFLLTNIFTDKFLENKIGIYSLEYSTWANSASINSLLEKSQSTDIVSLLFVIGGFFLFAFLLGGYSIWKILYHEPLKS